MLNDTDFADQLLNAREEEYERVTLDHLKATKQLLSHISDNPFLFTFLFLEYDYHNMKVLFKKKFGSTSSEPLLSDLAVYPCEAMQEIIFEEKQNIQFRYNTAWRLARRQLLLFLPEQRKFPFIAI